jgi:hypothetical protein
VPHSGECHGEETKAGLRLALKDRKLPKLKLVRQSLCKALRSENPEMFMMGSTLCNEVEEASRIRRICLDATIKVLYNHIMRGNCTFDCMSHTFDRWMVLKSSNFSEHAFVFVNLGPV